MMEDYIISDTEEDEEPTLRFPSSLIESSNRFNVNKNTKVHSMVEAATKLLKDNKTCLIRGIEDGSTKAVTLVELIKKNCGLIIFQWNDVALSTKIHYWNPQKEGMNRLRVKVQSPSIYILISTQPFEYGNDNIQCSLENQNESQNENESKCKPRKKAPYNNWSRKKGEAKDNEAQERRNITKQLDTVPVSL